MGPILGSQFPTAAETFASSGWLASYADLAPVPRDSERVTGNHHRSKRFHRPLRNVFYT
ncbi:transposase, partial [Actinomadura geliboluensis]